MSSGTRYSCPTPSAASWTDIGCTNRTRGPPGNCSHRADTCRLPELAIFALNRPVWCAAEPPARTVNSCFCPTSKDTRNAGSTANRATPTRLFVRTPTTGSVPDAPVKFAATLSSTQPTCARTGTLRTNIVVDGIPTHARNPGGNSPEASPPDRVHVAPGTVTAFALPAAGSRTAVNAHDHAPVRRAPANPCTRTIRVPGGPYTRAFIDRTATPGACDRATFTSTTPTPPARPGTCCVADTANAGGWAIRSKS